MCPYVSLRVRFEMRLDRPHQAQTERKAESGVNYVQGDMWPSLRFTEASVRHGPSGPVGPLPPPGQPLPGRHWRAG